MLGNTTGSNDTLSIAGGNLTVTDGASQIGGDLSMTGGYLKASGSGVNLTATGKTTLSGAGLYVASGATLSLLQLTEYTADNSTFEADGIGSVLDVSALTTPALQGNWYINTSSGGEVKLTGLSSLSSSSGVGTISINDNGGTLLDGNITTLDGVNATLHGSDKNVAVSWTQFTNGTLSVTGGSMSFPDLTAFSGSGLQLSARRSMSTARYRVQH